MSRQVVRALGRTGLQIDALALTVIKEFSPEILNDPQPFDIESCFEIYLPTAKKVTTDYPILGSNIHGYTDINDHVVAISRNLVEDAESHRFKRSTMAHETGHVDMHLPEFIARRSILRFTHDDDHMSLRLYHQESIKTFENPEWQAWRYAGALLMPRHTVMLARKAGASIYDLCKIFDVTLPFVKTRLRALKLSA